MTADGSDKPRGRVPRARSFDRGASELRVERNLRIEAEALEQVGIVVRRDPSLERRKGDLVACPVIDRAQTRVVAGIEIAPVDRRVRPVEDREERGRARLLRVAGNQLAGFLEEILGEIGLGVSARADEVEIGHGPEQVGRRRRGDGVANNPVCLVAER